MKIIALITFIVLSVISCNEKDKQSLKEANNQNGIQKKIELQNVKMPKSKILVKSNNDTLVIENRSAIIYEPTDKRINKLKKEVGEEDFYTSADDYLFYLNESNKYLESQKMKIVMIKNDKVLKFILADKSITTIKLDLEKEIWGIYLFDPKQKPKKIDMTAIADEFKEYTK